MKAEYIQVGKLYWVYHPKTPGPYLAVVDAKLNRRLRLRIVHPCLILPSELEFYPRQREINAKAEDIRARFEKGEPFILGSQYITEGHAVSGHYVLRRIKIGDKHCGAVMHKGISNAIDKGHQLHLRPTEPTDPQPTPTEKEPQPMNDVPPNITSKKERIIAEYLLTGANNNKPLANRLKSEGFSIKQISHDKSVVKKKLVEAGAVIPMWTGEPAEASPNPKPATKANPKPKVKAPPEEAPTPKPFAEDGFPEDTGVSLEGLSLGRQMLVMAGMWDDFNSFVKKYGGANTVKKMLEQLEEVNQ